MCDGSWEGMLGGGLIGRAVEGSREVYAEHKRAFRGTAPNAKEPYCSYRLRRARTSALRIAGTRRLRATREAHRRNTAEGLPPICAIIGRASLSPHENLPPQRSPSPPARSP